mgnify:CR=1 FL=1
MIQLFVYAQDNADQYDRELDTTGTRLQLRIQVADLRDITERKGPHSLTFNLPMTENNDLFFSHYFDANVQIGSWSPYAKTKSEIRDEGLSVLEGQMQLLSIDQTNQEYQVIILGQVSDVIFTLKGATWRDVLGVELDHESTSANIINSWDITNDITNGAGNGVVVYPLVDVGDWQNTGRNFWFNNNPYDVSTEYGAIQTRDLRPSVQIRYLIEKIFAYTGYAVSSAFFAEDRFNKLYVSAGLNDQELIYRALYGAAVGRSTNLTVASNTATPLAFSLETGDFFDPDGLFAGGVFIAPAPGTYNLNITVQFQSGGTGSYNFSLVGQTAGNTYTYNNVFTNGTPHTVTIVWNVLFASQGETMTFYAVHNSASVLTVLATGSNISLFQYDLGGASQTLDMAQMLMEAGPEVFLKEIIIRYNLAFIEEEGSPNVISCEPWYDLLQSGNDSKDWTQKIDRSQIFNLRPTTELQKTSRRFTDTVTDSYKDRSLEEGYAKGWISVNNDNVFTTDKEVVQSKFAVLRNGRLPIGQQAYSSICDVVTPIQYKYKDDGFNETVTSPPWIGYYLGTKQVDNADASVTIRIESTDTAVFPLFSQYSESPVTANSYGVRWGPSSADLGYQHPYFGQVNLVLNHVYRTYHQQYIESFTNSEARLLKCKIYLTAKDVAELKWNDKIFIDSSYWRILSISDFSVGNNEPVEVELIKDILGQRTDCGLNWVSSNADGTTNWEDGTGSVSPTESCCNSNGLHWDSATSTCRWMRPTERPGDTVSPNEENTNPNPPIVQPHGFEGTNFNTGGVSVSEINYPVTVTANNSGFFDFQTDNGLTSSFNLALANTYQINLRVIGQEQTTVGVFGDSAIAEFSLAYKFNGALTRQIGSTQTVMSTGDWTIGIQALVGGTSTSPSLSFQVAGLTGQTVVYSGLVSVVNVDLSNHYIPVVSDGDALWQDANNIAFQNGDEMLWN